MALSPAPLLVLTQLCRLSNKLAPSKLGKNSSFPKANVPGAARLDVSRDVALSDSPQPQRLGLKWEISECWTRTAPPEPLVPGGSEPSWEGIFALFPLEKSSSAFCSLLVVS